MKLIAVISHKGGAGKTTSAVQLAEELARRGLRTLLVDADRQQGAGLLLGIDTPAGCVQRTMVPQLDYLGSARLTDLEIADCYASVDNRFDVGVVDTPSLDDPLARAWLREAAATLMVLQVDPLTVKTLPSALNTLEVVRAFKPTIQILGLLPTMFDPADEAHGRLLAELLSRKPEAVFTPVVPIDAGLRHRANSEECPPIDEVARQAYQCAADRVLRALQAVTPSVGLPRTAPPSPPWVSDTPAAKPVDSQSAAVASTQSPTKHPAPPTPPWQQPSPAVTPPAPPASPVPPSQASATVSSAAEPVAPEPLLAEGRGAGSKPAAEENTDRALEALAGTAMRDAPRKKQAESSVPDWWQQQARVDAAGVARRSESWWMRSRFAIACVVACLALMAAIVMGTMKRLPVGGGTTGERLPAAVAATSHARSDGAARSATGANHHAPKKGQADRRSHGNSGSGRRQEE